MLYGLMCRCVIHFSCYKNASRNTQSEHSMTGIVRTVHAALCTLLAGRRCAPSSVDADETWSITGALSVMAAALPEQEELWSYLTSARQTRRHRPSARTQTRTFSEGNPSVTVMVTVLLRKQPNRTVFENYARPRFKSGVGKRKG